MTNRLTILAAVVIIVAPPLLALFALRIAREFDDLLSEGLT